MAVQLVDASAGISPLRRSYERPLWILQAVAGLMLLIAAVNLANLLLARATARRQEFSVRLAIGGTRARVLQQVLTESLLLAALGSIAAIGVAFVVSRSIPPLMSTEFDRIHLDLTPDWRVFLFTGAVGLLSALVFGMAPALRLAGTAVVVRADRGTMGNQGVAVRRILVTAQIAVTLVLLFGGLLFLRSLQNLATQDTGVKERNVVVATLFLLEPRYPEDGRAAMFRDLDERLQRLPGVAKMAEAYTTPLGGNMSDSDVKVDGKEIGNAWINRVAPGYFETLGTPIIAGRDINDGDHLGSQRVAVISKSMADAWFGGDAVGRRFALQEGDAGITGRDNAIVGVAADQKYADPRELQPKIMFMPSAQITEPLSLRRRYVIRTNLPPADAIAAISSTVSGFDPTATIRYSMLDTQIEDTMLQERLLARLSLIFGMVALLLALVGLYGVVSYSVAGRRSEIGVRVALGASRSRILTMILGDVGRTLAIGVAVGTVVALLAARAIASLLFGLQPDDVGTLLMASGVLMVAGLLAAAWPARRAAGIDPLSALRES